MWIRIFPDKSITMRAAETRMGSGKGNPEFWVAVVKPGRILFEMGGEEINEELARTAMRLAQYKLPVKTRFLVREGIGDTPMPAVANASVTPPGEA